MRAKVIDNVRELGLELSVRRLRRAGADEAAAALGCERERIARCAVVVADGDPVVCLAPADAELDRDLVADALDVAEVRLASGDETLAATGYPAAGVPPVGHDLPLLVERELLGHETIWTAAGDGCTLVELSPSRLASALAATVAPVVSTPA